MTRQHALLEWFSSVGIQVHPELYLEHDAQTGLSFYTAKQLARDTTVMRVPSNICITSSSAFGSIRRFVQSCSCDGSLDLEALPRADWILLYLVLCRVAAEYLTTTQDVWLESVFAHVVYVSHIPSVIETPLHFSPTELDLLRNTPLVGSTERRLRETITDYERATRVLLAQLHSVHSSPFTSLLTETLQPIPKDALHADALMQHTWHHGLELWRWAESAFTSRSFPPRLIGLHHDQGEAPILIPGYDIFNHARAHAVTWSFSRPTEQAECGSVEMTLNYEVPGAHQVYNNYGGKSNEEFLSSYAFTLDETHEDTLALKLSGSEHAKTHYWVQSAKVSTHHYVAQQGFLKAPCPCPTLLQELQEHILQAEAPPITEHERIDLYAHILELLESLLLAKRKAFRASQRVLDALPAAPEHANYPPTNTWIRTKADSRVRSSVCQNVARYRHGQWRLLNSAVQWTRDELERVADWLDAIPEAAE